MNKKKRRQMRLILLLSVMIAAVPVSLSLFFDAENDVPVSITFFDNTRTEAHEGSKVLPMLANK